jgi:hypothetical protein
MSISGYISVYNDWDILEHALQFVIPYIDGLIVVDGGYRWIAHISRQLAVTASAPLTGSPPKSSGDRGITSCRSGLPGIAPA